MKPDDYVSAARALIGTPFHKKGRRVGVGIDCVGVVLLTGWACGESFEDHHHYRFGYDDDRLYDALASQMVEIPIDLAGPSDVLAFVLDREPSSGSIVRHVGISTYKGRMVHVYGRHSAVAEETIDEFFSRRIRSAFRFPLLAAQGESTCASSQPFSRSWSPPP